MSDPSPYINSIGSWQLLGVQLQLPQRRARTHLAALQTTHAAAVRVQNIAQVQVQIGQRAQRPRRAHRCGKLVVLDAARREIIGEQGRLGDARTRAGTRVRVGTRRRGGRGRTRQRGRVRIAGALVAHRQQVERQLRRVNQIVDAVGEPRAERKVGRARGVLRGKKVKSSTHRTIFEQE